MVSDIPGPAGDGNVANLFYSVLYFCLIKTFTNLQCSIFFNAYVKGQVKDGFFVEAGADDFETHTNSLYFEVR